MTAIRVICIWAAVCLCLSSAAPTQDIDIEPRAENYRLPQDIMPENYKLKITPHLHESDGAKRFTFSGEVEITVKPTTATNKIVLHSKTLEYSLREYWRTDTLQKKTLSKYEHNSVTDITTYTLDETLDTSKTYILHFVYTGKMEDDMHGFYRSSYIDAENNTIWLGSTQFETNHARRAFPSFDEPLFKATFDLTLVRHITMNTFANSRLVSTTYDGYMASDVYATTPKMSTYLLAFIVSNFAHRFNGDFGIIARREFFDQSQYSFDVGQKLLSAFDDYLGLNYSKQGITKMDMAAIPDFSAGAMENWGLLTYRERNLLYVENYTTLNAKQSIAAVIAHEQAHMWFGDLVTCKWWSYTWLNEGFARYFQHFGTAWVEKDLLTDMQFVTDQLQTVMGMDSTNSTNPMSDENTNTPADLSRMFNTISYNKGAVFIRMVKHILGEVNFRASLQQYLNENRYGNTIPSDLFTVWKKYWPTEFANYADDFFKSYTTQVGYPVVYVDLANDSQSFDVSQQRFLLKENDGSDRDLLYTIPFTYATDKNKNFENAYPKMFLSATENKINVKLDSSVSWLIANVQEMGYYRVNYNEKHWHSIHHALYENNFAGIHELNRAQIVDDLLNLARSNAITYELAFAVLEYLETETHYLPWTAAFNGFNYLAIRLGTNTGRFANYIRQLTAKAYDHLGFEEKAGDTTLDIYNRAKILSWSCKFNNNHCISTAGSYFSQISVKPVPVNIRSVVYCSTMRTGNEGMYNTMVQKFKTEMVATEQTLILSALGCVKDSKLVEKHFWFIISDDVRRQDKASALSSLYSENNENVSPVFKLVTENYIKLAEAMGGYSAVASAISNIAARFTEESQKKDLEAFNKANGSAFGNSQATLNAAEVTVTENLAWAGKNLKSINDYFNTYKNGAASISIFTAASVILFAIATMLLN